MLLCYRQVKDKQSYMKEKINSKEKVKLSLSDTQMRRVNGLLVDEYVQTYCCYLLLLLTVIVASFLFSSCINEFIMLQVIMPDISFDRIIPFHSKRRQL